MSTCTTTCDKTKELYKWTQEEKRAFKSLAKWCLANWPSLHHAFANCSRTVIAKNLSYDWAALLKFEQGLAAVCMTGSLLEAAVKMADYLVEAIESLGGSDDPSYQEVIKQRSGYRAQLSASGLAPSL